MKYRHVTEYRPILASIQSEVINPLLLGKRQTVEVVELSLPEAQVLSMELGCEQLPNTLRLPYQKEDGGEVLEASVTLKVMMPDEMHIDDFTGETLDAEEATDSAAA